MTEIDGRAVCDERQDSCRCREDAAHDGPHVCPCGGSWYWQDGEFRVVAFPPVVPRSDLLAEDAW